MKKEILEEEIKKNKTYKQIAEDLNVGIGTINHYMKKYGLSTPGLKRKQKEALEGFLTCTSCKEKKELICFGQGKTLKNGSKEYQSYCLECIRKKSKVNSLNYYKNNKTKIFEKRFSLREWLFNLKKGKKCRKCNYDKHPAALDFHHIDENTKDKNISTMVADNLSKKNILKEIEKCEILCANCHRIEHFEKINNGTELRGFYD